MPPSSIKHQDALKSEPGSVHAQIRPDILLRSRSFKPPIPRAMVRNRTSSSKRFLTMVLFNKSPCIEHMIFRFIIITHIYIFVLIESYFLPLAG